MLTKIKEFADNSETLKEAIANVKEISLIKEIIVFILLTALITIFSFLGGGIPIYIYTNILHHSKDTIYLLITLFSFILYPIIIYFIVTKIEKRSWRSVGFSKKNVIVPTIKGLLIGFLMFLTVVIIGFLLGQYTYNGFDLSAITLLIPFLLGFMVQSFGEEFQVRGWSMTFLFKRHSIITAIVISNFTFMIMHLSNSGIDLLSLINLFLVGTFYSVLFLKYDNIWVPGGAHTAWNFSQGIIFGFNVSGMETPSLLKFSQVSQNIVTGGKFGPESSLVTSLIIIISLIIVIYWKKDKTSNK